MFNAKTFWNNRPAHITPQDWIFHPANPQHLPKCAGEALRLITALAKPKTWFKQSWLAEKIGRSVRWAQEILKRLEQIGAILVDRGPFQNYYRLATLPTAGTGSAKTSPHEEQTKIKEQNINIDPRIWDAYQRFLKREKKYLSFRKWWQENQGAYVGL